MRVSRQNVGKQRDFRRQAIHPHLPKQTAALPGFLAYRIGFPLSPLFNRPVSPFPPLVTHRFHPCFIRWFIPVQSW